jgi:hypothetical protein
MDWQPLFNAAVSIVVLLGGILGKILWEAHTSNREAIQGFNTQLKELERRLPDIYVRKDEDARRWVELFAAIHRIEQKLDGKVDKP